ncbi:hypothetical protein FN846DRAFT_921477 [Sphaerosporella brunnea]|uniref:Uncharacterized protein n=1 Tax=Sphaerosporella brunnea TaxID=1250544 RepID=A0A5J5ENT6_9PEZI|nr:hypothetical protein FN846DRAFT_921477 [Sphaerosporella brunnea]
MSTPAPYSLTVPEREASTSAQQRTRTPTLVLPESPLDSRYPPFTASSNLPSSSLAGSASSAPRAGLLTQADAFGNSSSYSLAPSQIPGSAHFLENDPEDGERDTFLGQDSYNEPGTFARSVEHRNNSAASRRRDIIDGVSLREAHRRDVLDGLSLREARLQAPRPVTLAVIPRASGFQEGYTPAALADASPFVAEDSELRGVYIPEENGDTIRARRRGGAETVNQVDNAGGIALQADDQTTSYEPSKEKVSSTQAREPATAGGMVEVPDVPGDTDHDRSNTGCKIERDDTRKSMVPWSRSLDKFHPAFRDETSKTPSIRSSLRSSDSDIRSPEGGWDIPLRTRHTRQQEITPPSAPQGAPANAYNRPPLIPNRNEPSPFGAYGSFSRMEDDAVSESGLTSRICDEYLQNTAELPERYLQHFTRDSHPYPHHRLLDVALQPKAKAPLVRPVLALRPIPELEPWVLLRMPTGPGETPPLRDFSTMVQTMSTILWLHITSLLDLTINITLLKI